MKLPSKFQKNISIFKVPVNFENSKTRHAIDMCPNVTFFFYLGSEILNLDLVKWAFRNSKKTPNHSRLVFSQKDSAEYYNVFSYCLKFISFDHFKISYCKGIWIEWWEKLKVKKLLTPPLRFSFSLEKPFDFAKLFSTGLPPFYEIDNILMNNWKVQVKISQIRTFVWLECRTLRKSGSSGRLSLYRRHVVRLLAFPFPRPTEHLYQHQHPPPPSLIDYLSGIRY